MKWISVEERLPGELLILITDGDSVAVGIYRESNGQWPWVVFDPETDDYINGWPDSGVSHWMPLPDPPKGE